MRTLTEKRKAYNIQQQGQGSSQRKTGKLHNSTLELQITTEEDKFLWLSRGDMKVENECQITEAQNQASNIMQQK